MAQPSQSTTHLSVADKRRLLTKLLHEKAARQAVFPLSHGQRGMWITSQMDRDNVVFNMPFCTRFRCRLDIDAFRQTMQTLVDRHACLRTRFYEEQGQLNQEVLSRVEFNVAVHDASHQDDSQIRERLSRELSRPFDLGRAPALRAAIFDRAKDDHICLLTAHHMIIDFWSAVVLQRELHTLYANLRDKRRVDLPPVRHSYREFVEWQQAVLDSERGKRQSAFWQSQLEGAAQILNLPNDHCRPGIFTHRGNVVPCKVLPEVTKRLKDLATTQKATLFSVMLTGFQILLGRYCNQNQFVVGSPFSGRGRGDFEEIVGCFVNLLPIRADLSGDPSFRQAIDRTFKNVMDVLENQDYPFSAIVEQLSVDRDPARPPLVQASFTMQKSHRQDQAATTQFMVPDVKSNQTFGALNEQAFYIDHPSCQHDLELLLEQSGDALNGMLRYYADAFDTESVVRIAKNFNALLDAATRYPDMPMSKLKWFAADERKLVVDAWNRTTVDFGVPRTIPQRFEIQVAKTPNNIAVTDSDTTLTYEQLDRLANRQANRLIEAGVQPQDRVAVHLDRSPELIVAILGIMKAGAAYVPLDPDSPRERKTRMLADMKASAVIAPAEEDFDNVLAVEYVAETTATSASAVSNSAPPTVDLSANDVAYVIFTSGSTGEPKGVVIEHKAIGNTISWRQHTIPVGPNDCVLLMVPHYFDASLCITLQALLGGANLVLADAELAIDPSALGEHIEKHQITLLPIPPRLLRILLNHGNAEKLRSVRRIHTGGEAMPPELPGLVQRTLNVPFENLYGPTETAVEATWKSCSSNPADANRIGKPIANVRTYILDEHQQPVPIGVSGELYIGGEGLARGYLNDDELTEKRFIADPFTCGSRLYRTGDLCRWLSNGDIEFIARVDHQVKVRGYRIELSEIENGLRLHDAVTDVAVVTHRIAGDDDHSLVAYIDYDDSYRPAQPSASEFRSFLESRLPSYMVPRFYEFLTDLPYTPSGKLDRNALPVPNMDRARCEQVRPRNQLETFLAEIWQELLPGQTIGIHDNFYDLGGSSLKGAMLLSRLQDRMGQQIRLATVFHLPDVASLARYLGETYPNIVKEEFGIDSLPEENITSGESASAHSLLVPLQPNGSKPPIFMVHPPGGIVVCYQALSRRMPDDQPMYGIRARGLFGDEELPTTLLDMAHEYVEAIRSVQPNGPYLIGGWSLGGVIAFEIAQQLTSAGETVERLIMLDTTVPSEEDDESGREYGIEMTFGELAELPADDQLPYLFEHARKVGVVDDETPETLIVQIMDDLKRLFHHHVTLANDYSLQQYPGTITMFRPDDAPVDVSIAPDRGWNVFASVAIESVPGQHHSMVKPPYVDVLAEKLTCLVGANAKLDLTNRGHA